MLALCMALREKLNIACVTNDIFTREDTEFLQRNGALPSERIRAIETGGCPHAAIREDISANLHALEQLQGEFSTQLLLIESGGDNLAANYSRELADYIIYGRSRGPRRLMLNRDSNLVSSSDRRGRRRQSPPQRRPRHHPIRPPHHQQNRSRGTHRRRLVGHGQRCKKDAGRGTDGVCAGQEWRRCGRDCGEDFAGMDG